MRGIQTEADLIRALSEPYPEDIEAVRSLEGDLLVLGAAGKMGPTLVNRAVLAFKRAGQKHRVYAVSRFTDRAQFQELQSIGAEPIQADLLNEDDLKRLPDCPNVIFMAGMKFGSSGNQPLTWVMNTYLPGRVAERFSHSKVVAFSTGNVYPFVDVQSGGATETTPPAPVGEYAQSCLGRERILEHFSTRNRTPMTLLRLNYAVEGRYGVLLDIGQKVWSGTPIDLEMGFVNVIWQGDANSLCLRSFDLCESPARILNITGTETHSVRNLARDLGKRLGKDPVFIGREAGTALLNNSSLCRQLLGPNKVSTADLLDLTACWIKNEGPTLAKPTKFSVRDGGF